MNRLGVGLTHTPAANGFVALADDSPSRPTLGPHGRSGEGARAVCGRRMAAVRPRTRHRRDAGPRRPRTDLDADRHLGQPAARVADLRPPFTASYSPPLPS